MKRRAFTFVELLIVFTIISILAAIAVPNFLEAQTRSRTAHSKANLGALNMSLEAYRLEYRAYPPQPDVETWSGWALTQLTTPIPYMTQLPMDPNTVREFAGPVRFNELTLPPRYINGLELSPDEGLTIYNSEAIKEGGFIGAALIAHGPSTNYLNDRAQQTFTLNPGEARLGVWYYDPTNGTTSRGFIVQRVP